MLKVGRRRILEPCCFRLAHKATGCCSSSTVVRCVVKMVLNCRKSLPLPRSIERLKSTVPRNQQASVVRVGELLQATAWRGKLPLTSQTRSSRASRKIGTNDAHVLHMGESSCLCFVHQQMPGYKTLEYPSLSFVCPNYLSPTQHSNTNTNTHHNVQVSGLLRRRR